MQHNLLILYFNCRYLMSNEFSSIFSFQAFHYVYVNRFLVDFYNAKNQNTIKKRNNFSYGLEGVLKG